MTFTEAAVIAFGLFGGYWVVSKLFFRAPEAPQAPKAADQPRWNEVLGIPPTSTGAEVRAAYQELISKYHPDKVEQLGQELKDLALRKSQEITAAYREGMRQLGEAP